MQTSLLNKYCDSRLPWYTIYPTVPDFSAMVGANTYGRWLRRLPRDEPVSIYLHVPFCRSICWYCGFPTSLTHSERPIRKYLAVLREEIDLVAAQAPRALSVSDVHFGGGTPTIISPADFLGLMELLRDRFTFSKSTTVAVEIDPRAFTTEMAETLGSAGVSRASIGAQSFDPLVQRAVNRVQSETQIALAVESLRQHGISRINFDLLFGLPHQSVQSCVDSARIAVAMRPDRLAVFGYAHVPSYMKRQRQIDEAALPDNVARAEQAAAVAETLVAAGYRQIGLDHFALPSDELALAQKAGRLCRNSLGYSADTCQTVIGFGPSAIGRLPDGYVQNELATASYHQHIKAGCFPTSKGYRLTEEDRLRAEIIERVMCDLQADVPAICANHGFDPVAFLDSADRLEMLTEDGIVEIEKGILRVKQEHRFVIRAVAAAFDAYLDRAPY
ncbi:MULTISPECIES: oxygen-independent coproporphyrinogen III oxidase [Bradyrhizobium]|uniref:Coproporphyrinogen-III oxidase n=2 Tax=Bradyrhizobium quebecense TaxID=2748629 RepID=A0A974AG41_9BRAD|nr:MULTISPECIES: oxygen-independent coproporphyrinogen III oxidase [Bradyrhizobium]UFX44298.1 oxygen-independent coproporphyrinogen III oxidase [Bradyrhizobium sp. 41S5]UGA44306.1 oxygen-independent coproporphyrinogen III oxidase [Bradyrhizobium quebecense]UGY00529.1 oxygen-independent coproporphyrinogen III oxidase [Bradyrhizobium quebecense]